MELKKFGNTDLKVSPLGLGLAALGRPGYINLGHAQDLQKGYQAEVMLAHSHQILNEAYRLGIRYFDAARSYGRAEEFLGAWLNQRAFSPEALVVGSKWGYTYTANWQVQAQVHEVKEHSLPVLNKQLGESRQYLAHHLKLYQIHSATLESRVLDNVEVLKALAKIKEQGIYIGLSLSGPQQAQVLQKALQVEIEGEKLFNAVQATWNLLETSVGKALAEAKAAGLGVIIKEALANGRLTSRNQVASFSASRAILERQAQRLQTSLDALALAGVLAQPFVDVVLSGAATLGQLQSNVKALEVNWDEEASQTLQKIKEQPNFYWKTRKDLAWN